MPTAVFFFPLFDTYVLPTKLHALSIYNMVLIVASDASQELRLAVAFVVGGFVLHDCRCMDGIAALVHWDSRIHGRLWVLWWALLC
jgi:hypothetical protein